MGDLSYDAQRGSVYTVLISIVVPCYNVEHYVRACLDSILASSEPFNLFVVDDCSTDSTKAIIESYKDSRLHKVFFPENRGLSAVKNYALDNLVSESDWIAFIDSDDYIDTDYYFNSIKEAFTSGFSFDILSIGCIIKDDRRGRMGQWSEGVKESFYSDDPYKIYSALRGFSTSMIVKASLYRGVRFPEGCYYEDLATGYKLIQKSKGIYVSKETPYVYRLRAGSITGSRNKKKDLDLFRAAIEEYEAVHTHIEDPRVLEFLKNRLLDSYNRIRFCYLRNEETEFVYKKLKNHFTK